MQALLQDLRFGLRMLLRNPGFTLAAVVTLGLGIGANTGLFSVLNAILLRSLPLKDSSRLMIIQPHNVTRGLDMMEASKLDFAIWRDQNHVFERIGAFSFRPTSLMGHDGPQRIPAMEVSADYFSVLGVPAALGRTFLPDENLRSQETLMVLSYELWEQSFGADLGVIGKPVNLEDGPATVVGVMPAEFELPFFPSKAWVLARADSRALSPAMGEKRFLVVLARLKGGVAQETAQAEMAMIARSIDRDYPTTHHGWSITVVPLEKFLIKIARVKGRLAVISGVVVFVLLIGCANVAGLLLARSENRRQEIAVRAALGAGRLRLIRQMLVESLLLALIGGGVGLLITAWWLDGFRAVFGADVVPKFWIAGLEIDSRVLGYALALSIVTALLFGLMPALQASMPDLHSALKEGGRAGSEGPRRSRLRRVLVAGEIALTVVLMIGAGLTIRNFLDASDAARSFDPDRVLTATLSLSGSNYDDPGKQVNFFQRVLERVGGLPEVQSAGVTTDLPLTYTWETTFAIRGPASSPAAEGHEANYYVISPGYLRAMRIPLLMGRGFGESEGPQTTAVALVNETLVRHFFPGQNPLGQSIRIESDETSLPVWREIVGVVGDVKEWPDQPITSPQVYVPYSQRPVRSLILVLRANTNTSALAPALRSAVSMVDKTQPVENIATLTQVVARRGGADRIQGVTMTAFACLALLMAAVGIYGIVAYAVSRRAHEIGIRMALGADRHQVFAMVFRDGMVLTGIGLLIGLVVAIPLPWVLRSAIPRFAVHAPLMFIGVPAIVGAVALLAVYIPARRATKVDPIVALRYE